jgi:L-ornithine N5-oxygenase
MTPSREDPSPVSHDSPVLDVVGVGFGPANLGLAIAVAERNAAGERPISALFLERQEAFGWHRGMLIPDARMQVAFLKDLATLRNPTSSFGFVSYLASRGRLVDFVNRQTFFPTRLEYHDYLSWAAAHFDDVVSYGTTVEKIEPTGDGLLVVTGRRGGESVRVVARAVVVATGLAPALPDGIEPGERIWHNSQLVPNVAKLATGPAPRRFVVVGAGQSAAESVDYLHRSFPDADVHAVFRRWGYSPADDSAFANRVFDPDAVHEFYDSPAEVRGRVTTLHRNTNYSVVDPDLIDALYERHYAERVEGPRAHQDRAGRHGHRPRRRRDRLRHRLPIRRPGPLPRRRRRPPGRARPRPHHRGLPARARRLRRVGVRAGRHRAHPRPRVDPALERRRAQRRHPRVPGVPHPLSAQSAS